MADYKDKIRKLLALAQSPEEAEAKAALLRARELMAQHKLAELDGHWNEAMELAVKYGFITQAYGGTATLATHKNQLEAFRAENYIRRQRDMNGIDMEVQA